MEARLRRKVFRDTQAALPGARVGDIARQLAAERLLLAAVDGLAGVLLASLLVDVFVVLADSQLPRSTTIAIDGRVLLCSLGLTTAAGLGADGGALRRLITVRGLRVAVVGTSVGAVAAWRLVGLFGMIVLRNS